MIKPQDFNLPSQIQQLYFKTLSWNDFQATQTYQIQQYEAHIYWETSYKYKYYFKQDQQQQIQLEVQQMKIPQKYVIKVQTFINKKKSYAKPSDPNNIKLLRHEYAHYLIGCLFAIKFKNQLTKQYFKNLNISDFQSKSSELFQKMHQQYILLQKRYDYETDHYFETKQQQKWQKWLSQELNKFKRQVSVQEKKIIEKMQIFEQQQHEQSNKIVNQNYFRFSMIHNQNQWLINKKILRYNNDQF